MPRPDIHTRASFEEAFDQLGSASLTLAVLDVDNNDFPRVAGGDVSTFQGPVVNVDHHGTNTRQATAGVVDPTKPAATMMIADVVDALDVPWTEDIATPLMLGMMFIAEFITGKIPVKGPFFGPMYEWFSKMMEQMTNDFSVMFIMAVVMAPIFEEIVFRGILQI